jgi:hypothetical protein
MRLPALPARFPLRLALATAALLASCTFHPGIRVVDLCSGFDEIANAPFTPLPTNTVLEDPGTIQVLHGGARAGAAKGVTLKIEQSVPLPPYANQAAVFLNGWRLSYHGSDQHVVALGSVIERVRVGGGRITWNAAALLRDDGGEEAFDWEYRFTVIAWNDAVLHAMVDQNDSEQLCKSGHADGSDNYFAADNSAASTAVATFSSFLQNPGFATGRSVAVLPRGFGFAFSSDHHLLELAYNLESVAPFVRSENYRKGFEIMNPLAHSSAAIATGDFVSWKTAVIMKDNDDRRYYAFTEVVSAIGGPEVELIQPEFTLDPMDNTSGALGGAGVKSAPVAIEHLPYAYAVPVLTGWDIGYAGSDQHVKDLGIWLDDLNYDRASGTLRYKVSSIVKDDDTYPDNFYRHKVTILGFRPAAGRGAGVQQTGVAGTPTSVRP